MPGTVTYWREGDAVQNMGDYLSELFLDRVAASPPRNYKRLRLVGSVISDFIIRQDLAVAGPDEMVGYWGCGQRDETRISPALLARCRFHGVRGPLTRDRIGLPATTPLGDPGLLLPVLHTPRPHPVTIGKSLCVPHIHDTVPDRALLSGTGVNVVLRSGIPRSLGALLEAIDAIAGAEFVLCGALHAAIIACAYGRPFAFYSGSLVDLPFKWLDTSALLNIPAVFVRHVEEGRIAWASLLSPPLRRPRLLPLLEAFPGDVKPGLIEKAREHDGTLYRAEDGR